MGNRSSAWLALAVMAAVGACGAPSQTSSPMPSASASESPVAPSSPASVADCPTVTMAGPNGEPVDLTGEWGGGEWFPTPGTDERTFILQRGACVWAVVMDAEFRANPSPDASQLAMFYGLLREDFTIDGTLVVMVRWNDPFNYGNQAPGPYPMAWRLEYDESQQMTLVEDRVPGVQGPRCPNAVMWCPDPTVLVPIQLGPEPTPG